MFFSGNDRYTPYPPAAFPSGGNSQLYSSAPTGPPYNANPQQAPVHHLAPNSGYPQMFSGGSSAPSRSSGSVTSSDLAHRPRLCVNNMSSHQEVPEPDRSFPLPPPPQSFYPPQFGRTSRSSCENSIINDRLDVHAAHSQPQMTENGMYENRVSRSNSRVKTDGGMGMSLYNDQGARGDVESYSSGQSKPVLPSKPPYTTASKLPSLNHGQQRPVGRPHVDQSPNSGEANGKARSCDSGLPCEDLENDSAELVRPLLPTVASGQRGPLLAVKNSLKMPSASSSMSECTQITAETRIS